MASLPPQNAGAPLRGDAAGAITSPAPCSAVSPLCGAGSWKFRGVTSPVLAARFGGGGSGLVNSPPAVTAAPRAERFFPFPLGFGISTRFWDRPFRTLIPEEETFEKED